MVRTIPTPPATPNPRSPFPIPSETRVTRPTALTMPVNIADGPPPVMYLRPRLGAPRAPSAALGPAASQLPRGTPARRLRLARRAPESSRAGPPAPRRGAWRPVRRPPHITPSGSPLRAAGRVPPRGTRGDTRTPALSSSDTLVSGAWGEDT